MLKKMMMVKVMEVMENLSLTVNWKKKECFGLLTDELNIRVLVHLGNDFTVKTN